MKVMGDDPPVATWAVEVEIEKSADPFKKDIIRKWMQRAKL